MAYSKIFLKNFNTHRWIFSNFWKYWLFRSFPSKRKFMNDYFFAELPAELTNYIQNFKIIHKLNFSTEKFILKSINIWRVNYRFSLDKIWVKHFNKIFTRDLGFWDVSERPRRVGIKTTLTLYHEKIDINRKDFHNNTIFHQYQHFMNWICRKFRNPFFLTTDRNTH